MAKYTDFLPYVLPYVSSCPAPLAEQHVRDICIDFCRYSLSVQETLAPINAVANVATYALEAPRDTKIHLVMNAWYKENILVPFNTDSPIHRAEQHNLTFANAQANPGTPHAFLQQGQSIMLDVPPLTNETGAITVRAALIPSRASTSVADVLLEDYGYEIGQGVVARLMLLPGQAFSAPGSAAVHMGMYMKARSDARIRSNKASGRSNTRINPVRF